jgi:hypothetical protein
MRSELHFEQLSRIIEVELAVQAVRNCGYQQIFGGTAKAGVQVMIGRIDNRAATRKVGSYDDRITP